MANSNYSKSNLPDPEPPDDILMVIRAAEEAADRAGRPADYWSTKQAETDANDPTISANPAVAPGTLTDLIKAGVDAANRMHDYRWSDLEDRGTLMRIRNFILMKAAGLGGTINATRSNDNKIPLPKGQLSVDAACEIILGTCDVARIAVDDCYGEPDPDDPESTAMLCYYSRTGRRAGTWTAVTSDLPTLNKIVANLGVKSSEADRAYKRLSSLAPEVHVRRQMNRVAFADGLLEIDSSGTRSYTPYLDDGGDPNPAYEDMYGRDAYVVGKIRARYRPGMPEPSFACQDGYVWRPGAHIADATAGNTHAIRIIYEALLFAMRGTSGGRCFWLLDGSENGHGGGGKSTTADMIGAAIGAGNVACLTMDELENGSREHTLGLIVGKSAIIGHETSAGQIKIENTAVLKRIMRNQTITINEKYLPAYPYAFKGLWIQCMNTTAPKISEKQAAFYRTLVPIFFPKTYTKSEARKAIADTYCKSQDVADWIANYAVDTYGLINDYDPTAVSVLRERVADIRAASSVTFAFLDEYFREDADDADVPVNILHEFCAVWADRSGYHEPSIDTFKSDLVQWCALRGGWRVETYEHPQRKKYPWPSPLGRWVTDNPSPGKLTEQPHPSSGVKLADRVVKTRTRVWLVRDGSVAGTDGAPDKKAVGDGLDDVPDVVVRYNSYRAAIAYIMAYQPDALSGLTLTQATLAQDAWINVGTLDAVYGNDWSVAFRAADGVMYTAAEYAAAVRAGMADHEVLAGSSKFHAAAKAAK